MPNKATNKHNLCSVKFTFNLLVFTINKRQKSNFNFQNKCEKIDVCLMYVVYDWLYAGRTAAYKGPDVARWQ